MQVHPKDKNLYASQDQLLGSLVRELKNPLILIARQAELEQSGGKEDRALESIQSHAEKTLKLIDSYLLAARSEYGQHSLPLEPIGVGSVIYEVAQDVAPYMKEQKIDFATDIKDGNVMANRQGLAAAIRCLSELVMAQNAGSGRRRPKVRIYARRGKESISVSVLGSNTEITNRDLELARRMQGGAYLAGGRLPDSGIRLAIADILAGSLGARLQARKISGLKGLNFELPLSRQLRLV